MQVPTWSGAWAPVPDRALRDACQSGCPFSLIPVVLALAALESNFDPQALGDQGCSVGYLQLNTCGGLGTGYDPVVLRDGPTNFRLGCQAIVERLQARGAWPNFSPADLAEALRPWSVLPALRSSLPQILAQPVVCSGESGGIADLGSSPGIVLLLLGLGVLLLLS